MFSSKALAIKASNNSALLLTKNAKHVIDSVFKVDENAIERPPRTQSSHGKNNTSATKSSQWL